MCFTPPTPPQVKMPEAPVKTDVVKPIDTMSPVIDEQNKRVGFDKTNPTGSLGLSNAAPTQKVQLGAGGNW